MNGKPNARVLQNNFYSWKIPVVLHQSQKETHSQLDLWYTFNFLRWSSTILQRYIKPIIIIIHQTSLLLKFIINKQTSSFTSFRTANTIFINSMLYNILFCLHSNNKTSLNCALCSLYVWKCMLLCWYFAASSLSNNLMQFGRNWYHVRNE